MRIRRVKLEQFRCFEAAEFHLGNGVTYVGGANGAGKSTLLDAIAVALTGTCRGSETGRGLGDLRRSGAGRRKWQVELELVGPDGQAVTISRKEGEGPRSKAQGFVDGIVGIPGHQVRAALYSGELLGGDDKLVQQILLELASPGVEIDEYKAAKFREATGQELSPGVVSLAELDDLYRAVYDLRREVKREFSGLMATEPPVPEGLPDALRGQPVEVLEKEAERVRRKIQTFERARDGALREAERIESRVRALEEELGRVRESLGEKPEVNREEIEADLRRLDEARRVALEEQRKRREKVAACTRAVEEARARVEALEDALERVASLEGTCPTCRREVTPESRDQVVVALDAEIQEAKAALSQREQELRQVEALPEPEDPAAIRKEYLKKESALGELEAYQEAAARLAKLEKGLEAARAELQKVEELRQDAAALNGRIEQGKTLLAALERYIGAVEARGRIEKRRKEVSQRLQVLDYLVRTFGPDGIRTTAADGVDVVSSTVREIARRLGFDVDLGAAARREGPVLVNGRPARLLSSSERLRVGLALQIAVARATGLGFVVFDDVDRCVGRALAAVQQVIREAGRDLQVLVLSAVRDEQQYIAQAPALAARLGWTFLHVTGGKVLTVAEGRAAA